MNATLIDNPESVYDDEWVDNPAMDQFRYYGPRRWPEAYPFEWINLSSNETYVYPEVEELIGAAVELGFKLYRTCHGKTSSTNSGSGYWLRQADYEVTLNFLRGLG